MTAACRLCGAELSQVVIDLGAQPLANAYVDPMRTRRPEPSYPLVVRVCAECFLVQAAPVVPPGEIFSEYAYLSSYSDSWLAHVGDYSTSMRDRLRLGPHSFVVEVGSNDGSLLRHFCAAGIPVLGIDPAANVAEIARAGGVETMTAFFGTVAAREIAGRADLLVANNVLAHVPDLHDFVEGMRVALAPHGTITLEFPHVLRLLLGTQFDTIYHEHLSYFSLRTAQRILAAHALDVVDVEEIPTHGGSLRVHAQHAGLSSSVAPAVDEVLQAERAHGLESLTAYERFRDDVSAAKASLVEFLAEARDQGKRVAGYGAPAKASTLLNYCGVGPDLLEYTVDRSPHKQGRRIPGVDIPIHGPERIAETRPDYVVVLAWNLRDEVLAQMAHIRGWGGRFVIPVPQVEVVA